MRFFINEWIMTFRHEDFRKDIWVSLEYQSQSFMWNNKKKYDYTKCQVISSHAGDISVKVGDNGNTTPQELIFSILHSYLTIL